VEAHLRMKQRMKGGPRNTITSPSVMVKAIQRGLWPTPTVHGNTNRAGVSAKSGDGLRTAVMRLEAGHWPTPTARLGDQRGAQAKRYHDPKRSNDLDDAVAATGTTGSLNPTWVEWLMGFPPGWTDCDASVMQSSLR
jgi:hypothetical protein